MDVSFTNRSAINRARLLSKQNAFLPSLKSIFSLTTEFFELSPLGFDFNLVGVDLLLSVSR